ncbi:hypothetical protein GW777_05980 [Candidatus Peregrinibacteria bacterium]|nr:hypothetical protein [bacterium]NCQ55835.1 hypothetical protein [Candidatus Parcubacteria bacterium]NCS67902.1 hypothetical protein [Candidatus Peregrinibacteria bacterium]
MKSIKLSALLLTTVLLAACGSDNAPDEAEMQQQMAQAAQIGQAQAIAQIIDRAMAEPCQPINLFNNLDEANKKEVNLINVACESLDLPEIPATTDTATDDMMEGEMAPE